MAETTAGPVATAQRSAAPDAARGLALLGIALANSVVHLTSGPVDAGSRPVDGSGLDHAVAGVISLLVDRRTLPAFALVLGYGAVMVLRRQEAADASWPRARGVLVRRWLWLTAFGAVHVVLLFFGDILLAHGITGLVLMLFLRRSGQTLLVWAACLLVVLLVVDGGMTAGSATGDEADVEVPGFLDEATVLGALVVRVLGLFTQLFLSPLPVVTVLPPVLLGVWAARRSHRSSVGCGNPPARSSRSPGACAGPRACSAGPRSSRWWRWSSSPARGRRRWGPVAGSGPS